MRFFLLVTLFSCLACGVPRQRHAAALRELELARGRLSDSQSQARDTQAKRKEDLAAALLQAEEAESKRDAALGELEQLKRSLMETSASAKEKAQLEALLTGLIDADGLSPGAEKVSALRLKRETLFASGTKGTLSLTSQGEERLREAAALLTGTRGKVLILGHEDGAQDNVAASAEIALKTARALVDAGVSPERISISAFGAARPLCTRDRSPECVAENRRVEVVLLPER